MQIVVGAVFLMASWPALASCPKPPSPPSCLAGGGPFETRAEQKRCDRRFESYKSGVEDFLSCLVREGKVDPASKRVIAEYGGAVDRFNARVRW
jgi:hypothetical protein